jgi:NTP pyrophosphatase (non-canonical NTP hydrolase)
MAVSENVPTKTGWESGGLVMDFSSYQAMAMATDQVPHGSDNAVIVPLLGLAGEAGELLGEYKKHLRDGAAHQLFAERVAEELGDLLWYISNVASKFGLDLEHIAQKNLTKCGTRWGKTKPDPATYTFDDRFPDNERLPRQFEVEMINVVENGKVRMQALLNGQQIGDDLTDNAWVGDGYRFHDVFHLAYAAVLGWSPVTRKHLRRKRKSNPLIDEVEDGARAIITEECISVLVFEYAKGHNFLAGISALDYDLLKMIKSMTANLEVSQCTLGDWEKAILAGYEVWREIERNRGGRVLIDLNARSIIYDDRQRACNETDDRGTRHHPV